MLKRKFCAVQVLAWTIFTFVMKLFRSLLLCALLVPGAARADSAASAALPAPPDSTSSTQDAPINPDAPFATQAPLAENAQMVPEIPADTPESALQVLAAPETVQPSSATPRSPRGETVRAMARRLKLPLPLPKARIEIYKSLRRLDIYSGQVMLKSYSVALGWQPTGAKQRQGDGRTPEGSFRICRRDNVTSDFHIFLGLTYPEVPDAERGLRNNQITPREAQVIRNRLAARAAPLWRTNLGGWVGIHGGTDAAIAQKLIKKRGSSDWTAGCIALTDREIEEIYAATAMGTPVNIHS